MLTLKEAQNYVRGQASQKKGSRFEIRIANLLDEKKIYYIQIPQSTRVYRDRKTGELKKAYRKNKFDFIVFFNNHLEPVFYFDTKTTKNMKMPYSYFVKKSSGKKESSQNQYDEMCKNMERSGFGDCGFVIQFGDKNPKDENLKFFDIFTLKSIFKKKNCITPQEGLSFKKWLSEREPLATRKFVQF